MDEIIKNTLEKRKQALVFVSSKRSAESTADKMKKIIDIPLKKESEMILKVLSTPTEQCKKLSNCVAHGCAFHHSGLLPEQRSYIEKWFREGKVKVICSTPTLAAGLSLPAFRTIIKSLKRYQPRKGMAWIPVLEYFQMAGRAGRPEHDDCGEAIVIAKDDSDKEKIKKRYIKGKPEKIYSKMAVEPVLRAFTLSLISSLIVEDKEQLIDFFSRTFWAHQYGDMSKIEAYLDRIVDELIDWNFIKEKGDNLFPTLLGRRISELCIDPLSADHIITGLKQDKELNEFTLLTLVCGMLELRPLIRMRKGEKERYDDIVLENYDELLYDMDNIYDLYHFFNIIKTGCFFMEWINEKDEKYLCEEYKVTPGEIRVKMTTMEWLIYSAKEISKFIDLDDDKKKIINKLERRIKYGVKEDLLPLIAVKGIGRVRARKLYDNKIRNIGDLKRSPTGELAVILGPSIAKKVKLQLA